MLPSHLAAMRAIEQCRTEALGGHLYYCADCDESWYSYHSCRNRHCPKCQQDAAQAWLEKQHDLLLPVPYFLVTFTLPQSLRSLARIAAEDGLQPALSLCLPSPCSNWPKTPALSAAKLAWSASSKPGLVICATIRMSTFWFQAVDCPTDGQHWLRARNHFFVHVKPLARLFRGKMRDGLRKQGLLARLPTETWRQDWVVDCRPVGKGETALKYLAPYVFRVALSNKRILKLEHGQVTFRYQDGETKRQRTCTLSAEAFIQRFLQHVLPKGFVKVRYYGLLAPSNRKRLAQAKRLLGKRTDERNDPQSTDADGTEGIKAVVCPHCGQPMTVVQRIQPRARCPP